MFCNYCSKSTAGIEYAEKEITEKSPYEALSVIFLAIATLPDNYALLILRYQPVALAGCHFLQVVAA